MSADEMFEKLGYEEQNMQLDIQSYINKKECIEIDFDLRDKRICISDGIDEPTFANIQELQAINKKVEELRVEMSEIDNICIELKDIVKLQKLYIEIYEEEDEDCPDRRIIVAKENSVQRILDKITNSRFKQGEIWKVIQIKSWDNTDNTYRPICNRLRELGYKIMK